MDVLDTVELMDLLFDDDSKDLPFTLINSIMVGGSSAVHYSAVQCLAVQCGAVMCSGVRYCKRAAIHTW